MFFCRVRKSLRSKRAKEKENHPIINVMTASIAQGNGTYQDERGLTRKKYICNRCAKLYCFGNTFWHPFGEKLGPF